MTYKASINEPAQKPVLVIGGPTASGKSGLALSLASSLSGVIINDDSMQIYQGLPLLTAHPSEEDFLHIPHRLYASLSPDDTCSAARWRNLAFEEIRKVHSENKLPIIVGGSGFYLKTLLQGISPVPDIPSTVRDKISALQKEMGNPEFHQAFSLRDPVMTARLDPFNTQRIIRAWEVLESTGKSLAEWHKLPPDKPPKHLRFLTVFLLPERKALYASCNTRFEQMLKAGVLDEIKQFKEQFPAETALSKALGYSELSAYLDGNLSLPEAIASAQQSTRHYAKRQVTWFRHQIVADLILDNSLPEPLLDWIKERL
ncbi:MAG: tRNA (adenosine(37)-N6)-dimethylallyltransferase MiaA [Alphaproteobacteria bacterium]|nr:tRNA (adenosine(37)-N6)-dimethylallyltransferase MiaA [Alphaproteobacteria bacterium]